MALGPVQLLVASFDAPDVNGEVLAELERLRESDSVRLVDVLIVRKDAAGVVERVDHGDAAGAAVSALIGEERPSDGDQQAEEEFWSLDEVLPNGSVAAIALVEHRWAIGLRDAIRAAGGVPVADAWVHPTDLAAAGLTDRPTAS